METRLCYMELLGLRAQHEAYQADVTVAFVNVSDFTETTYYLFEPQLTTAFVANARVKR